MQLFQTDKFKINKTEKVVENDKKECCKCGEYSSNTIQYTEEKRMCMNCYCELIAKRETKK